MIKTLYFFLFVTVFSLGMWACTGKEIRYKNLTSAQFEQLIKDSNIQLVDVLYQHQLVRSQQLYLQYLY